jgi:serine/threonine protein kinase
MAWPLPVGESIAGRYRLEALMSADHYRALYRGKDAHLPRAVTIEILRVGGDASGRTRFDRAVATLAALEHPNIASILDHGVEANRCYRVLEWLEGETLASRLAHESLTFEPALSIIRQLLAALASAHAVSLVHGNLNPSNVFLQQRKHGLERVKLLDFRFAGPRAHPETANRVSASAGSANPDSSDAPMRTYCAPEALADARSDVFSVGMILTEMLASDATPPADASGPAPAATEQRPPAAAIDAALQGMLRRATAEHPAERFADAAEMLCALIDAFPRPVNVAPPEPAASDHPSMPPEAAAVAEPVRDLPVDSAVRDLPVAVNNSHEPRLEPPLAAMTARPTWRIRPLMAAATFGTLIAAMLALFASPNQTGGKWWSLGHALFDSTDSRERSTNRSGEPREPQRQTAITVTTGEAPPEFPASSAQSTRRRDADTHKPPARDPWLDPVPPGLQGVPAYVATGGQGQGNERIVRALRDHSRDYPNDPRGHLLLGRLYCNRLWRANCLAEWALALRRDPSARGAPELLPSLVQLVAQGKEADAAAALIAEFYGREALGAIEIAAVPLKNGEATGRLHALSARIAAEDAR